MRTTIDLPDGLLDRVKDRMHREKTTFRSLVIAALEKLLEAQTQPFQLRDASAGFKSKRRVSSEEINRRIDEQREPNVPQR